MKLIIAFSLLLTTNQVLSQSKIDSIKVYYVGFNTTNIEAIRDPVAFKYHHNPKIFTIINKEEIGKFKEAINELKQDKKGNNFFDIRLVCDIYCRGKIKKELIMNPLKGIFYNKHEYFSSEKLTSLLLGEKKL